MNLKFLSKEFDSKVLHLVKEKDVILMSIWMVFEKFMNMFLRFGSDLKKSNERLSGLVLKMWYFVVSW